MRKTTRPFASDPVWLRLSAGVCAQECAHPRHLLDRQIRGTQHSVRGHPRPNLATPLNSPPYTPSVKSSLLKCLSTVCRRASSRGGTSREPNGRSRTDYPRGTGRQRSDVGDYHSCHPRTASPSRAAEYGCPAARPCWPLHPAPFSHREHRGHRGCPAAQPPVLRCGLGVSWRSRTTKKKGTGPGGSVSSVAKWGVGWGIWFPLGAACAMLQAAQGFE